MQCAVAKPRAFAHILLLSVHTTYIWLDTLGLLWMAPKRSAVWEGWVRLDIPPPGPNASVNGCGAVCLSGSTLDASAAGPRFESRWPSRPSGGLGKGKQRVGWQPPVGRGRWWGALLQVAGILFAHHLCGRTPVLCSGPSGCGKRKNQKREGPQSPVGRGRCEEALLQAGFEPAIYATTANDGNHYATLPPLAHCPVIWRIHRTLPTFSTLCALDLPPLCPSLSRALVLTQKG